MNVRAQKIIINSYLGGMTPKELSVWWETDIPFLGKPIDAIYNGKYEEVLRYVKAYYPIES